MSVKARLEVKCAYILRSDDVRRIWTLLENGVGQVEAAALCADDIEREFKSVDELLNYDNIPTRKIASLEFSACSADKATTALLYFNRFLLFKGIEFTAEGPEKDIVTLKHNVTDFIQSLKPWYSLITRDDFGFIFFGSTIAALCTILVISLQGILYKNQTSVNPIAALLLFLGILAILGLIGVLSALRSRYFPVAAFVLGKGEERYRTDDNVRWVVFVGFFVSLAAAVALALVWR